MVRIAQPGSELLAIDRKAEHLNSTAAARAGVGAPVLEYVADPGLLVVGFIDGRAFTDDDIRGGAHLSRIAAACRQLHGGPRFVSDFNMFDIQRGYLDIVKREGFRLPARYLDFMPQVARIESAFRAHPQPTVPCNNDLLAGNFIDDGDKIWLIDYEYSGNNDPCFELGNIWSEANLSLEQLEELMEAYDGRLFRQPGGAGAAVGPDVEVRLDPVGVDPGVGQQHRLRLLGVGDGEVRTGGRRVRRPRVRPAARRRGRRRARPYNGPVTALEMGDQVLSSYPVLDAGDDRPAHTRIEEWLERLIHSGQLKLEDRLPSEVEMAGALGVSRMTLRQALNGLESKGLLVRKRGRWGGSFVARPRLEYELSGLPGFTEQMRRSNAMAGARVTEAATVRPEPEVRHALQLARGHKVHRIVRVRSANREPVAVEVNSYPAGAVPRPARRAADRVALRAAAEGRPRAVLGDGGARTGHRLAGVRQPAVDGRGLAPDAGAADRLRQGGPARRAFAGLLPPGPDPDHAAHPGGRSSARRG